MPKLKQNNKKTEFNEIFDFRLGMSMAKQKESLIRDRDQLTAEVYELNKRLQQQRIQNDALEKKRAEFEEKCGGLYRLLDVMPFQKQQRKEKKQNNSITR